MDSSLGPEIEVDELDPKTDEDARPMGQHAAKKKNAVRTQIDSRINLVHEKHAKENAEYQQGHVKKLAVLKELATIGNGRFEIKRQLQETLVMGKELTGMDRLSLQYWTKYKHRIVDYL